MPDRLLAASAEKTAEADKHAGEANERAGKADEKAGTANKKAGELEVQAEQLRQANLDTQTKLTSANAEITQLNAQRIGLEQTLYPRILFVGTMFVPPKNDPSFERLKKLSETKIVFRYVSDAECRRALHQIKEVLKAANWELSSETPDDTRNEWFWDGVNIEWPGINDEHLPPTGSPERRGYLETELAKSGKLRKAAEELAEYLRELGWNAIARPGFPPEHGGPPYDAIQAVVGFKPLTYFNPDTIKQMNEQMRELQHKILMEERKEDERFPPH